MARGDNRNYNYQNGAPSKRKEFSLIVSLAAPGSRVVDLGCGDGVLLDMLVQEKDCICAGIELAPSGVAVCREKGLAVSEGRIDEPLPFADNQFDLAVCNVSMQMVMYPEVLLSEMKRIAPRLIISFPNFAFYRNRLELALGGRMPRKMLFGYNWYDTGHIHQFSIRDFEALVEKTGGLRIVQRFNQEGNHPVKKFLINQYPNLFQVLPVFLLERS